MWHLHAVFRPRPVLNRRLTQWDVHYVHQNDRNTLKGGFVRLGHAFTQSCLGWATCFAAKEASPVTSRLFYVSTRGGMKYHPNNSNWEEENVTVHNIYTLCPHYKCTKWAFVFFPPLLNDSILRCKPNFEQRRSFMTLMNVFNQNLI